LTSSFSNAHIDQRIRRHVGCRGTWRRFAGEPICEGAGGPGEEVIGEFIEQLVKAAEASKEPSK
jgi:hypothetical protein